MARRRRDGDRKTRTKPKAPPEAPARTEVRVPGWLPAVLYGVVTIALFRRFVFSDLMLVGQDTLALGYMARDFFARALRSGTFPLWNPLILGGTPFVDSLAGGDSLYPTSLLLLFLDTHRALGWKLVLHVFLAGLVMYGWLRALDRSRQAALLGGLAWLLAPVMVSLVYPGHDGKLFVTALTPLLFWTAERSLTRRGLLAFVATSLVIAVVILSTHFQMAYFLFGAVGLYYVFRVAQIWKMREGQGSGPRGARAASVKLGLFLVAALLGGGVSAVQLLPAVRYVTEFSRRTATTTEASGTAGVEYSSSWSLHPEEVVGLVVPEFTGSNAGGAAWSSGTYWGRNPFKLNHEYVGVVVLLLAGLAFFGGARASVRYFLLALGLTGLLYALGRHTPVWRVFYEVVPGVGLFRAPSIAAFLPAFAAVTLAGFGFDRWFGASSDDDPSGRMAKMVSRYLWGTTAALGLATLLAASGALETAWTGLVYRSIDPGRRQILQAAAPFIVRGLFVATFLVAATASTWWALGRKLLAPVGAVALLALLIGLDLGRVDDAFVQVQRVEDLIAPDTNMRFLEAQNRDLEPQRVFSMVQGGQDVSPAMHGLELAAGHHPNDLARYRELIGMVGSGVPENLFHPNVRAILNVRWLLWPEYQQGALEGLERVSEVTLPDGTVRTAVYADPAGLPRARLVTDVVVREEDEVVEFILSRDFDPRRQTVLSEPAPPELDGQPVQGSVTWVERGLNRQRLRVRTDRAALLVISDNWYPEWRALVGGAPAPVLRADHTLRAIPVPVGEHEVELFYDAGTLQANLAVSLASLAILLAVAALSIQRSRRERRSVEGA